MSRGNRRTLMYTIKHRDPDGIGISRKITQTESQKIEYIVPILEYIIKHNEFFASELKHNIPESNPKSIDNTIALLHKKNLITLIRKEIKNKKIYKINSLKEIKKYRDDLEKYRKFKIYSKALLQSDKIEAIDGIFKIYFNLNEKFQKGIKKSIYLESLPKNFFDTPLIINNKKTYEKLSGTDKKFPDPLSINEMGFREVIKINWDYRHGCICRECFKEGKLQYFTYKDEEYFCNYGHPSDIDLSETTQYSENKIFDLKKTSKNLTDKQFEYQKNQYLKAKKTKYSNSQIQYLEYLFGKNH